MDKRAREDIFAIIISSVVGLILLGFLGTYLASLSCSSEKSSIQTLTQERDSCVTQYTLMNQTIANCSNLIQEQIDNCDKRIDNATQTCQNINITYENWFILYKIYLIVYVVITFVLWLPLSINLFKIVVKIGLKKEWEEKLYKLEKFWLILKISVWVILTLIGFVSLIAVILSNPAL